MNCDWVVDWSAVAAFIAAGAAWIAAYLTYKTAKGSWKASIDIEVLKLREKWLASLRTLMSEFIAEGMRHEKGKPVTKEFFALFSQILLSMSPEKNRQANGSGNETTSPYSVKFSEIENKMTGIAQKASKGESISADLGSLQVLFHKYLKLHWDRLQEETVNNYAKNK